MTESRFKRAPTPAVIASVGLGLAVLAIIVFVVIVTNRPATGKPGRLSETPIALPDDIALPELTDATEQWGLGGFQIAAAQDQMAGGVAIEDLDDDGDVDLVVANGDVAVLLWNGAGYDAPQILSFVDAIAISTADLDRDGRVDLLVSRAGDGDAIVWGGEWVRAGGSPEITDLVAAGPSSGLLVGELSGDDHLDIVRLGRGIDTPFPDILWVGSGTRTFDEQTLPVPDRFSLAGELVDADRDGLLDIWLTRDVGWAEGGDSLLSRQGDPTGEWVDIAASLGIDLEVDGMGITMADLNRDQELDAYVSDLGDNELLLGDATGFRATFDTGAAHIRPIGAPPEIVSSTWGTGALDLNLDGVLDLVAVSGGFPAGTVRNKIDDTTVAVSEPPAVLLGLGDGTFSNVWPELGLDLDVVARGLAVGDLDGDGDSDVVIVDRQGPVYVLRNDSTGPSVTVTSAASCADLAGAVVTVSDRTGSFQRLLAPHGYASEHEASVSVGVAGRVEQVVIEWPNGDRSNVGADPDAVTDSRRFITLDC